MKALRIGGEGRIAEIDGAYFGGHVRPENLAADRIDRRLAENQSGKRQVVVAMRERGGRTLAQVFPAEADAVPTIRQRIAKGTMVHADESPAWNKLHARFRHAADQPSGRLQHRRRLHQWARDPISPACAAANSGITTISPGHISFVTPRRQPGVRTSAASATASRPRRCPVWRCDAGHRWIFAATGNALGPPRCSRQVTTPADSLRSIVSFARLSEPSTSAAIRSRVRGHRRPVAPSTCMIRSASSRVVTGWSGARAARRRSAAGTRPGGTRYCALAAACGRISSGRMWGSNSRIVASRCVRSARCLDQLPLELATIPANSARLLRNAPMTCGSAMPAFPCNH